MVLIIHFFDLLYTFSTYYTTFSIRHLTIVCSRIFDRGAFPLKMKINSVRCDLQSLMVVKNADNWSCDKPVIKGKVSRGTKCKILCPDGHDLVKGKHFFQLMSFIKFIHRNSIFGKDLLFICNFQVKSVIFTDVTSMVNGKNQKKSYFHVKQTVRLSAKTSLYESYILTESSLKRSFRRIFQRKTGTLIE